MIKLSTVSEIQTKDIKQEITPAPEAKNIWKKFIDLLAQSLKESNNARPRRCVPVPHEPAKTGASPSPSSRQVHAEPGSRRLASWADRKGRFTDSRCRPTEWQKNVEFADSRLLVADSPRSAKILP